MGLGIQPLIIKIMLEAKPSKIHNVSREIGRTLFSLGPSPDDLRGTKGGSRKGVGT